MCAALRFCVGLLVIIGVAEQVVAQSPRNLCLAVRAGIAVRTATVVGDVPPPIASPKVRELVAQILDERIPAAKREELIRRNPGLAGDLIGGLTAELTPGTAEEYRRIPWILGIALGAGKGNDSAIVRSVLEVALPEPNQPLHDWRAAAIGGGLISAISQPGRWPRERMHEILLDQKALQLRWQMALKEASKVVEDPKEALRTRYDAMRMLGLGTWDEYGPQLARYLQAGIPFELQMGAISALADIDHAAAVTSLINGLVHCSEMNRPLAIDGLLRGDVRRKSLIEGLEQGPVRGEWLTSGQQGVLLQITDEAWRERARVFFKK